MGLIAFVTEPTSVTRILEHLELLATPPLLDDANQAPAFDPTAPEPVPDFEFDQRVSWYDCRDAGGRAMQEQLPRADGQVRPRLH